MSLRTAALWRRGNLRLNGKSTSVRSAHLEGDCLFVTRSRYGPRKGRSALLDRLLLLAMTLFITSCLPLDSVSATEIPFVTDTALPTGTIVWFPPSATSTLLAVPTYTATPEMSPGIGKATLTDDFSDETLWDTAVSDHGSAAIGMNRL